MNLGFIELSAKNQKMRKLKLQMVTSIDGFVKADYEDGEHLNWDTEVSQFCIDNLYNVDTILVGGKNASDFIPYWKEVANNPADPDYQIGKLLTDIPKIVFSRSITSSNWDNTTLASGDLIKEIQKLKKVKRKGYDRIWWLYVRLSADRACTC